LAKHTRICVCLLLASTASAQTIQQAESLWKAHQYKEAGQVFESLVKIQPKNPDYKVRYGRLLLDRCNRSDAAKLVQEALEIKKDHRSEERRVGKECRYQWSTYQ